MLIKAFKNSTVLAVIAKFTSVSHIIDTYYLLYILTSTFGILVIRMSS